MNELIHDYPLLPRWTGSALAGPARVRGTGVGPEGRVGVISNRRSHRNRRGRVPAPPGLPVLSAAPETRAQLTEALRGYRAAGVRLLVVDGGDGTVRDVLTCGGAVWDADWPVVAVVPSGKTNALAIDLGVPDDWTLESALAVGASGGCRTVRRAPLEIIRPRGDAVPLRGFLLGGGAFVDATRLAQHTHRAGAFRGVAVGLALAWALGQTVFGSDDSAWRAGTPMTLAFGPDARALADGFVPHGRGPRYILLVSALERLPLGLKPFGPERAGMKTLLVDAPPRRMVRAVPPLLRGAAPAWLAEAGYHRVDAGELELVLDGDFILDGEIFPGGSLLIREARPLTFAVP